MWYAQTAAGGRGRVALYRPEKYVNLPSAVKGNAKCANSPRILATRGGQEPHSQVPRTANQMVRLATKSNVNRPGISGGSGS